MFYVIFATILILGIFYGREYPKFSLQMKLRSPRVSQSSDVEINLLHRNFITIVQNTVAYVNWSVIGGTGKYYKVVQGSQDGSWTLELGLISSDIYPLSIRVDSTQHGDFYITLVVYNATYTISDTVGLTVEQVVEGLTIPQIILIFILCIIIVAFLSAGVFYRRKRQKNKLQGDLGKETKSSSIPSGGEVSSTYPDSEDQMYLLTTKIIEIIVFMTKPLKIADVVQFKRQDYADIDGPAFVRNIYQINQNLQNIKNLRFPDRSQRSDAYLTCVLFPKENNLLGIVTTDILLDNFVINIKNALDLLFREKDDLLLPPEKIARKLIQNLHLDRSYEFEIPNGSKLRILGQSKSWQSSLGEGRDLTEDQLKEVEADLEDMSLGEVEKMVEFLDKNQQEILEESKQNPESDPK